MGTQTVETQLKKEVAEGVAGLPDFASYQDLDVGEPESSGFLFGPRISYETDDKNWTFSAAAMLFGSYSTSIDSSVSVTANFAGFTVPATLPISTDLDIEYREIDLRALRMLTNNFGVFAGYMYQSYSTDLDANY
ncbi:MAG TPA: hypothetical protein PK200_16530, partial [Spirochaetota bacterium]|nr:hypothetical protein [Spirochaetota bacterium]